MNALKQIARALDSDSYPSVPRPSHPLHDAGATLEMMRLARSLLFPGFFDEASRDVEARLHRLRALLDEQARACTRFRDE